MVEKWRLPVIGVDKELENALFVHFSSIVGTPCTFGLLFMLVLPFTHKYVLLSAHFLLSMCFLLSAQS